MILSRENFSYGRGMIFRASITVSTALCALIASAMAGPGHHHGEANLIVEIEDRTVSISFQADLFDLVGFESAPSTPDQEAAIAALHVDLTSGDDVIVLPPSAKCELVTATTEGGFRKVDGKLAAKDETHDVLASWIWSCESANPPRDLKLKVFEKWPKIEKIDTIVFQKGSQSVHTLTRTQTNLDLR